MEDHSIFSKLKFISRLQVGDKINTKYLYIQKEGIITKLSRMFYDENRNNTLNFIKNTVHRSFEILTIYDSGGKEYYKPVCIILVNDLNKCKTGLQNLKETYLSDIKFSCDIDTILELIDTKLTLYEKYKNE
jgi:hypothetical protein